MEIAAEMLEKCLETARAAGEIVRKAWNKPHKLMHKGSIDLVTETDFAVQSFLRRELDAILPCAGFLGEENDGLAAGSETLRWVVDPVDGTTNFAHNIPMVGVSIALCEYGKPVLGIINAPMLGELYHAVRGKGAWLNGRQIEVSSAASLLDTLVATGFPYEAAPALNDILARLARVLPATQGLRRAGAASLDLAWVACGRLDAYYEYDLKPWDMAAGWLLVEEAGGKVTTIDGKPVYAGAPLLASNGLVHESMLELLRIRAGAFKT